MSTNLSDVFEMLVERLSTIEKHQEIHMENMCNAPNTSLKLLYKSEEYEIKRSNNQFVPEEMLDDLNGMMINLIIESYSIPNFIDELIQKNDTRIVFENEFSLFVKENFGIQVLEKFLELCVSVFYEDEEEEEPELQMNISNNSIKAKDIIPTTTSDHNIYHYIINKWCQKKHFADFVYINASTEDEIGFYAIYFDNNKLTKYTLFTEKIIGFCKYFGIEKYKTEYCPYKDKFSRQLYIVHDTEDHNERNILDFNDVQKDEFIQKVRDYFDSDIAIPCYNFPNTRIRNANELTDFRESIFESLSIE